MNKPLVNKSDTPSYNVNFLTGIYCLFRSRYKQAIHLFLKAVYETDPLEANYCVYMSYLVLSEVLMDHKNDILHHCYHSSKTSFPIEPEVQLNLACAELIKGDRRRAFQAMEKIDDLDLSANNSEEIHSFFNLVGKREINDEGLLKRNEFIYKFMGKLFRKKENFDTEDIEAFIINMVKNRYNIAMLNQLH